MSHISYIQYKTIKEMEDYKQTLYNDELLNILPDGVIIFDTNGEVIQLNQQAFAELHVHPSVNDMLPFPTNRLFKLLNKKEDILSTILEKIRQGENTYSLPEHTFMQEQADYTQFPVRGEFATIRDRTNLNKILFFFRNITVELTQEYILNTALQRTRIYPWYYDISRSEFTLDDRYFEHLGIPAGENNTLTMEEYVDMIHPDDRKTMADAFVIQLNGNTTFDKTVPFRLRREDGTWEWFEGQSTYIANISGHPYRLVGICLSIQEYKDIENTLIEARKKAEESDRLKMAFLANMSHEIRTPLNAIVGFSDVIGSTYDELSEEERADFVRLISINSEHLVRLIDDILDLSKIESNTIKFTFSDCSLNSLMIDIEKEQAMKPISEIEIRSLLPDEDVYINTDITRLKQVICNFINNARKFTQKGYIHFGYTLDNRDADSVQIFVEDTGSGIPQECLNEIFDRFYKVDTFKQGTGLGLSICKTIVEHLQGDISVKSEIGKGSCFTVKLPFDRKTDD
jgi:signal transduction histidine kinase